MTALLFALLQAGSPALQLAPCGDPALPAGARCGRLQVLENRSLENGRKISLRIVVLPATGADRAPDPVFFLAGGPGSAIIDGASGIANDRSGLRQQRDFVLVDQRGTGGSHTLNCDFYGTSDTLQHYLGDFIPAKALETCRDRHAATHDLTQYTTVHWVDDLDEVRAALGYRQINLNGGSYGTRAALEYIRRHGEHVRTATLYGVVPPSLRAPRHFARDAQRSLDTVLAECAADPPCKRAFPNLAAEVAAVFQRLRRGPVTLTLQHPATGRSQTVSLGYDMVAETLRYLLYSSSASALVPVVMHEAARGNFEWLARRSLQARGAFTRRGDFDGLYVAITCAEDLPTINDAEERAEAKGTFLGDYRLRQQRRSCEIWPRSKVPADLYQPIRSDVPVLMITGELDPVTPPGHLAEAAKGLTRGLQIVVPDGAHSLGGLAGLGCVDGLVREFIVKASTALDTSCVSTIRRQGFPTVLP